MDMVGGGPETKAIFHVTRGPASLPSFINDVAEHFAEFVNEQSAEFAGGSTVPYPMFSAEGGKEPLEAAIAEFSMGSDHQVYTDSSFGIPAIYLNDWPDRYIHTNLDTPANIDPTKLKRAAFIGGASAYYLANLQASDSAAILQLLKSHSLQRTSTMLVRRAALPNAEAENLTRFHLRYENRLFQTMDRFFSIPDSTRADASTFFSNLEKLVGEIKPATPAQGDGRLVFRRNESQRANECLRLRLLHGSLWYGT
jgi:hypothetical protein